MSGKELRLRPKARAFKSRAKRGRFFRELDKRTDRKARRNRKLWELDERRIEAALIAAQTPCQANQCDNERSG